MATNGGLNMPTEDLIFSLDVGNSKCVPSSTTDISNGLTSLVTSSICEGANGSPGTGTHSANTLNMPTYLSENGGVLNYSGDKGININEDLGSPSELTYSIWVKWPAGYTTGQYLFDARNNGGQWHFSNYANYNVHWHGRLAYNFGGGAYDANKWDCNEWINLITASDNTGSAVWVNGSNRTADAYYSNSATTTLGKNLRIGTRYTTSGQFKGLVGPVHIFTRKFTDNDAMKLFKAYQSRFKALDYEYLAEKAGW